MKKLLVILSLFAVGLVCGCGNVSKDVTISLEPGHYYGQQTIHLSTEDPDAVIRYTLDGTDPKKSDIIYDKDRGIKLNYTSDLKATAGGKVAEAQYEITPFTSDKNPKQQAFFNLAGGKYTADENLNNNFIFQNSTVTFEKPDGTTLTSPYLIKSIDSPDGRKATLVYTGKDGTNESVQLEVFPDTNEIKVGDQLYYYSWEL